jgi:hypothetical protein
LELEESLKQAQEELEANAEALETVTQLREQLETLKAQVTLNNGCRSRV